MVLFFFFCDGMNGELRRFKTDAYRIRTNDCKSARNACIVSAKLLVDANYLFFTYSHNRATGLSGSYLAIVQEIADLACYTYNPTKENCLSVKLVPLSCQ